MKKVEKIILHAKAGRKSSQKLAHHGYFLYAELGNVKRVNVTGLLCSIRAAFFKPEKK